MGNKITLDNWNQGGVADSIYSGIRYANAAIVGLDIHSKPALIKAAQKLTKDSGTTVTELCKVSIACSDGNTYWFSSETGKIWKRTSAGVYSLLATLTAAAGEVKILGAAEYGGFVYIATESRLHRISVANLATCTSPALNWNTFTCTDKESHQMLQLNNVL